jgi:hypothetical protein
LTGSSRARLLAWLPAGWGFGFVRAGGRSVADAAAGRNLVAADSEFACDGCSARYPVFAGLPCLVPDPLFWRALWLRRLGSYATGVGLRVSALREEAQSRDVLPRTSRRLRRLADGLLVSVERMNELFEPMRGEADELAREVIPPRPEPGEQTAILECYENLFRDWFWGGGECAKTLELVAPLLPERPSASPSTAREPVDSRSTSTTPARPTARSPST